MLPVWRQAVTLPLPVNMWGGDHMKNPDEQWNLALKFIYIIHLLRSCSKKSEKLKWFFSAVQTFVRKWLASFSRQVEYSSNNARTMAQNLNQNVRSCNVQMGRDWTCSISPPPPNEQPENQLCNKSYCTILFTNFICSCDCNKYTCGPGVYWGVYASIRRIPTSGLFCRRILTSVVIYEQGIRGLYAV